MYCFCPKLLLECTKRSVHRLRLKRAFAVRLLGGPGSIFNDIRLHGLMRVCISDSRLYKNSGLEKNFWTNSSCGASGLIFSLVLTPVELVLKSGILKETTHNSITYLQLSSLSNLGKP